LKYSSPLRTAKIHFQSQIINDEIVLTVCDNGLGIDLKEHGKDIFGFNKVFHKHPDAKGWSFLMKAQVEGMAVWRVLSIFKTKLYFKTYYEYKINDCNCWWWSYFPIYS
jgi:hypothetical protein